MLPTTHRIACILHPGSLRHGLLAVAGGLFSLPVANLLLAGITARLPRIEIGAGFDIELNTAVFAFAGAVTLATVLLFGLLPAIKATRTDPGAVVRGQASQAASSRGMSRFRSLLAGAQIALSMLLLALARLFAQSLANVARVDLGMHV